MEFCPKCGAIVVPTGKGISCSCGYRSKKVKKVALIKEKVKETEKLEIIEEDTNTKTLPLTDADCPKCDHPKAHYWLLQTRSSDEPETRFFQCQKCQNRWRDYN
jgi:transcription factor S